VVAGAIAGVTRDVVELGVELRAHLEHDELPLADVIDRIEAYEAAGLNHMIFWNETPFGDPEKVEDSYRALHEVVEYFADRD
jgi:alpha-galactosidase/6-phospho-beta-glucosidase family protein